MTDDGLEEEKHKRMRVLIFFLKANTCEKYNKTSYESRNMRV